MSQTKAELLQTKHQGELRLGDADSSKSVGFKAPSTVGTDVIWTLPAADGTNGYALTTNGSGVLSWAESGDSTSPSFTGDVTLTNDGSIVGFSSLNATYTGSVKTYTVTVASKTSAHRYNGTGSGNGYKIDGKEAPFLTLTPGRTYKFDQADSSNSGHPLRFYLEANKTTAFTTGVTTSGTPGNAGAYTQIVVSDTTPQVLHYQCSAHGYMGNSVQANSNVSAATAANTLTGNTLASGITGSSLTSVGTLGSLAVSGNATVGGNATITGNLTVSGTTTTVDSVTLSVKDKNIEMGVVSSPSDTTADGGGITLKGSSDHTFNWINATDAWTSSEHIHLIDSKKLFVGGASGTTDGLEIFHDGSHSYLSNTTGNLYITEDGYIELSSANGGEKYATFNKDGAVTLYHDNAVKFATSAGGIVVTGTIDANDTISSGNANIKTNGDTGKFLAGASNDLQLFHDGTNSNLQNATGELRIQSNTLKLTDYNASHTYLRGLAGNTTELYFDNIKKFQTEGGNNAARIFGNTVIRSAADNMDIAVFSDDGSNRLCNFYANGTKRLETTTSGVNVVGALTVNGAALGGSSHTATADGAIAAGDPVSVTSAGKLKKCGEVTFPTDFDAGSTLTLTTEKTEYRSSANDPHKSNRFVVVYRDDAGNNTIKLAIITVSGTTITSSSWHTVDSNSGNSGQTACVFDHVTSGRVLVIWGRGSATKATLVNFTGNAGSETISNVSGATAISAFGNNYHYVDRADGAVQKIRHYGGGKYLHLYQKSSDSTTWYVTFQINGDSVNTIQGGQFWAEASKGPAQYDLDPSDLTKGISTIVRTSNFGWFMRTFEINSNDTVSVDSEEYVLSSSTSNRVNREYGLTTINYVGPGQFVVSTHVNDATTWGNAGKTYHNVWKIIKVANSSYTKSINYFGPTNLSGTPSSSNEILKFVASNHSDNRTIIAAIQKWNSSSNGNPLGFRVTADLANNTLSISNQEQVVNSSNVMQYPTIDMGGGPSLTSLFTYQNYSNNSYARVFEPGGPGDDLGTYIGLADASASDGNSVTATIVGGKATTSGLVAGKRYYVQLDGTLGTTPASTEMTAGVALSSSSLLITRN